MSAPILAAKLYVPPPRRKVVRRSRLIARLDEGLHHKLILVAAPAGFGKTTLISEWVASRERLEPKVRAAWLSLDEGDNDPTRFLTYLVAALQPIAADIGGDVLKVLQSPQPPPAESILTLLLNDLTTLPGNFVLVLDDYHVIEARSDGASWSVDDALTFLLEHLPPQMHLVVATREDPQLPLARYRARGQLTELRAGDLRFTPAEAAEFLHQVMGLTLSAEDTAALDARTEGWIVGLQLAALSMQGLQDTAGFIQSFSGSHHFVLDYLLEEVLHKQPEGIQAFLLRTSILDRLCGPLCEAVVGHSAGPASGQTALEYLERANLFSIRLDNERRWYRYHHLFVELLRNRLARTLPDQLAQLHRRASDWYANNDFPYEAITHALAVQDWSRAADVIERYSDELPMRSDSSTRLRWFESFPAQVLLDRPRLGMVYAWALFMSNQLDQAEQQLDHLMPFVHSAPSLLGELYVIRLMIAVRRYDMPAFIDLARQALACVPPDEASPRSRILLTLGVAYDELGRDFAAAKSAFREAFELGKASPSVSAVGNAPLPLTALAYLADYEWLQGNLCEASRRYEQALVLADKWGGQSSIALCLAQQGLASLLYEWNDLDGAARALQECLRIGDLWKSPRFLVPAYGLSALVRQARGQAEAALAMVQRAEQAARNPYSTSSDLGMLALYQIAVWIAHDDFQAIAQWEQGHDAEWRSQTGRARHALAIVLARARIARHYRLHDEAALGQARALIEPALEQAQAGGLRLHVARLLMLDALARYAQGETTSSLAALERALALAEPEKFVRSFLDLGQPMRAFLLWTLESGLLTEAHLRVYADNLSSQFRADTPIRSSQPPGAALIHALTERELEVLRLIAQGLSNREISERLFIALSTVKGHIRIIFDKLQVQRRTEAVARARELGLV